MGTFRARMDTLAEHVGSGTLVGTVDIRGPYAAAQERGYWVSGPLRGVRIRNHPRGGDKGYLSRPFTQKITEHYQRLARSVLPGPGSDLESEMFDITRDLCGDVRILAPVLTGWLRNAPVANVYSGGVRVRSGKG